MYIYNIAQLHLKNDVENLCAELGCYKKKKRDTIYYKMATVRNRTVVLI